MSKKNKKAKRTSITGLQIEASIPVEEALKKFSGRISGRTYKAAQRMSNSKKVVKVPKHAMRMLWTATGGWKEASFSRELPKDKSLASYCGKTARIAHLHCLTVYIFGSEAILECGGVIVGFMKDMWIWENYSRFTHFRDALTEVIYRKGGNT